MTLTAAAGFKACLLIPFYHPECLLPTVKTALDLGLPLLVVVHEDLDPSLRCQLGKLPRVHLIPMPGNWNKGEALALGLKHALCLGYDLAASLDATGRYEPQDVIQLLAAAGYIPPQPLSQKKRRSAREEAHRPLKPEKRGLAAHESWGDTIVIGAEADPKKRRRWSFMLSNFWFWIETGLNVADTRSSLRIYPLMPMNAVHPRFGGAGWEIEAMARSAWGGIRLVSVPVPTREERLPPQARSWRRELSMAGVHIYLVLRRLLPFPFKSLVPKKKIQWPKTWREKFKFVWHEYLWNADHTPGEIATAIGFGVFTGLSPFWGWHTLIGLYFAQRLHLNKVLVVVGSYLPIPPLLPFAAYGSLVIGKAVLEGEWEWRMRFSEFSFSLARERLAEFVIGSLILAAICGSVVGLVSFLVLRYIKPRMMQPSRPRP